MRYSWAASGSETRSIFYDGPGKYNANNITTKNITDKNITDKNITDQKYNHIWPKISFICLVNECKELKVSTPFWEEWNVYNLLMETDILHRFFIYCEVSYIN